MGATSIEWTDQSINPIRARDGSAVGHYCEMVSSGCAKCYASALQKRFRMPSFTGKPREPSTNRLNSEGVIRIHGLHVFLDESKLLQVLKRRKPTKYFWCDMTDMFGSWVPDEWIDKCFATMALTPQHTHQVLTKRPERMAEYAGSNDTAHRIGLALATVAAHTPGMNFSVTHKADGLNGFLFPNVWLGTSVENQQTADERIPHLLRCPAAVRFLSCEPLLGPVDLHDCFYRPRLGPGDSYKRLQSIIPIHWVIVGGESGPDARPCNIAWVRSIIEQCKAAGVSCFVKQLGAVVHARDIIDPIDQFPGKVQFSQGPDECTAAVRLKDKKGGDPAEWPEDLRVREFPTSAARIN